jgi:hypothetical protein
MKRQGELIIEDGELIIRSVFSCVDGIGKPFTTEAQRQGGCTEEFSL